MGDGPSDPAGDFLMTVTPLWTDQLRALGVGREWEEWPGKHLIQTQLSGWGGSSIFAATSLVPSQPRYLVSRVEVETFIRAQAETRGVELCRRQENLARGAKLTVDATGRSAHFARRAGAEWCSYAPLLSHQMIVSRSQMPPNSIAVVSSDDGWWFAASAGGRTNVMFMSSTRQTSTPIAPGMPPELAELVSECRLGPPRLASMSWLEQCSGEGWFAVGDAALAVDPICGAGLETAAATAGLLDQILDKGEEASRCFNDAMLRLIAEQRIARHRLYTRAAAGHRGSSFWSCHATL
ncbi:hypothetical protein BSF44_36100 [Pseudomonas sp. ACN8]|nr:hypothetical protein BSF44_36100 [Pseudomonas sp. ACN8]